MARQIRFNAFDMNCVGHQSPGLWAHPRDRSYKYKDLDYWQDLARTLERGVFDGIFIADVIGYYDVYRGSNFHAIQQAAQIPVNDPLQLIAPIALATEHLGIGVTASTSFEHPYTFARRLSTADHHTKGRVGWNIVTSYLESGAKNIGQGGLRRHDNRYEVAAEYVEVLYKLLEGSWEEGAVVRDGGKGVFTNPDKVHEIGHKGKFFDVPGYHLCEPSLQRTPVLYQAGASGPGKSFAAQHAECVFVAAPTKPVLKAYVADVRRQAAAAGRDPRKVLTYNLVTVIVGETDAKAQAKFAEYQQYASYDAPWCSCPDGAASTSVNMPPPISSGRSRPMRLCPWSRIWPAVRNPGPSRSWHNGAVSEDWAQSLSAHHPPLPTSFRAGSRRLTSTASISLMP
jgi:long-chain alkane monooxygenase